MENTSPQTLQPSSLASSPSQGKMVIIGLGVLALGLAIAYGGSFLKMQLPQNHLLTITPPVPATPTSAMPGLTHYINTAYGYSIYYPKDLQLQGQGLQATNTTAPDVLITTDVSKSSPNPARVLLIKVQDISLLTQENKPISSYSLQDITTADVAANVQNKNTYVSTLSPLAKLQPLPGIPEAYTFTIRSKGYQTITGGALWDQGDYVMTEFNTTKYHFVLVYSNTNEMKQAVGNFQLSK